MGKRWELMVSHLRFSKSIPWRALQKIKKAFEMRFAGEHKEDIETWLRNIIVLIQKKMRSTDWRDR